MTRLWTIGDDESYRAEVERRYRQRTPPTHPDEIDPGTRVVRSEMRTWSLDTLGKKSPETDYNWLCALNRWYKRMSKRIEKEAR